MRLSFRKYIIVALLLGVCSFGLLAQDNYTYAYKTLRTRNWGDYPIVLSNEVKGGIHHIAGLSGSDYSEVNDSIPAERRQIGMLCAVGGISWTASDIVLMYNGSNWNRINFTRVWESGATYYNGQTVYENGNLYVARIVNPTSQPSLNTTEWHNLASKLDQILVSDADANDALTYNTTNHEYDVNVDNSTIEISGDNLQVSDLGITTGKLNNDAVTAGKLAVTGNGTSGQILSSSADGTFFWEDASNLDVNPDNIDLSSARILVGNGSDKAQERAITGDVSITNQGLTTVAGLVTNANAISAEETARIAADATLTLGLAGEVTNRSSADAAIQSELDVTQTGAGLGAGGTYSANGSANYIASSTSLTDADDDLDAAIKINADAIADGTSDLQDEVDAIEAGSGLDSDGDYVVNGSANYISGAANLNAADVLLDTQSKANADAISSEATTRAAADVALTASIASESSARTSADNALQSELNATQTGAGLGTDGSYATKNLSNYITTSTSLADADDDLDSAIKGNADAINSINSNASDVQTEIDAIETGSGLNTNGSYNNNGSANYISGATTLNNADVLLDAQINTNAGNITINANAIAAEATARIAADATLQADIDAVNQLNSGQIYVGNGSNIATSQTMSGDAALSNLGAIDINSNVIGANELNVSGNGTSGQVLSSDGSGALNWQTFNVNTSTVSIITSATTLDSNDQGVVMCNGNFTVTLPNASTEGLTYTLKNIGSNKVVIDGNGSQTIDGELNFPLDEQFASITLVSYSSAWYIVDRQSKKTVHIGNPGVNGSWRITLGVGNTLSFEQYNGTNWIYKMEIED